MKRRRYSQVLASLAETLQPRPKQPLIYLKKTSLNILTLGLAGIDNLYSRPKVHAVVHKSAPILISHDSIHLRAFEPTPLREKKGAGCVSMERELS